MTKSRVFLECTQDVSHRESAKSSFSLSYIRDLIRHVMERGEFNSLRTIVATQIMCFELGSSQKATVVDTSCLDTDRLSYTNCIFKMFHLIKEATSQRGCVLISFSYRCLEPMLIYQAKDHEWQRQQIREIPRQSCSSSPHEV